MSAMQQNWQKLMKSGYEKVKTYLGYGKLELLIKVRR